MKCEICRELLSWYLEEEIQYEEIKEHLSTCKKCSEDFKMLKEALKQVRTLPQITPPDQTCLKIIEKIKTIPLPGEVIYKYQIQEGEIQKTFTFKSKEQSFVEKRSGINYKIKSRLFKWSNGVKKKFIKLSFS